MIKGKLNNKIWKLTYRGVCGSGHKGIHLALVLDDKVVGISTFAVPPGNFGKTYFDFKQELGEYVSESSNNPLDWDKFGAEHFFTKDWFDLSPGGDADQIRQRCEEWINNHFNVETAIS